MPRRHIADLSAEEIAEMTANAGKEAQAAAHAKNVPYSIRENGRLWLIHPDGRKEEITGQLPGKIK
ncbi:MAG: hypothetical protein ACWA5L_06805 [bacterium]